MGDWIDLGSGHMFKWTGLSGGKETPYNLPDEQGIAGIIERHFDEKGEICEGYVPFANTGQDSRSCWEVISLNPLEISPSINCTACSAHGFIREGRWV
jgi:hypothetical protein